ncbi:FG-GAP repeat domain-containing protein, partial [Bacteroidota bacterium]
MKRLKYFLNGAKCLLIIIAIIGCNSTTESNEDSQQISFTRSAQSFTPSSTFQIELGDVDSDGDLDAAFANMGNYHSQIWLNDGSGNFTNSGQLLTQQGHGIGMEDLDGDNDIDLFISCASFGDVNNLSHKPSKIYFNDGAGIFTDSNQDLGDTEESGNGLNLIDIDVDGDLDAHIAYYALDRTGFYHKIYLNNGQGQFTEANISFPFDSELGWHDIDNDGDVDVFLRQRGANYKTLLNDGSGNFTEQWSISNTNILYGSSAFGDFDNDGDFDVITTNADNDISYPTTLFLNDGTGSFTDSGQQLNITKWA